MAFYHGFVTNPYFRREYNTPGDTNNRMLALWNALGGSDPGWVVFSAVPPLPPGVPAGRPGIPYLPWTKVDYKLPPMEVADLEGRKWTEQDFNGKTTIAYLWASWCVPCWSSLPAIQMSAEKLPRRPDIQILTLSVDEDREKLLKFIAEKHYTFPVLASKVYVERVLPQYTLGQLWIVDRGGNVRLQRTSNDLGFAQQALADELLYKAAQQSMASAVRPD